MNPLENHSPHPATTLHHYTYGHKLLAIQATGALIPTGASIPPWEKRALWFSSNPHFEQTALKPMLVEGRAVRLPFQKLAELVGVHRFSLHDSTGFAQWPAARKLLGIRMADADKMESVGRRLGALPGQWWASVDPVPLDRLELQVWRDGCWQQADLSSVVASGTSVEAYSTVGPRWE
jgi:hypothetical protein